MNPRGSPTNGTIVGRSLDSTSDRVDGREEDEVVVEMMEVGTPIKKKKDGSVRIGFNNINGMGTRKTDARNSELHGFISSGDYDIFGMTETNVNWKKNGEHIRDITYGWFRRMGLCYEYYREYPCSSNFQVGGVAQMAIGEITGRIIKYGGDETGQGRWTWQTFKGKKDRIVRIITAYRPVKNKINAGSAWNQQQFYADTHLLEGNPHERWLKDLLTEVIQWMQQGESIILLVDLNDNITSGKTARELRRVGLIERVTSFHRQVATHQRGSTTIDGIFTTSELVPTDGGYVQSMSDHLGLWLDFEMHAIFDNISQAIPAANRRLQCADPRLVEKYGKNLWKQIRQSNINNKSKQRDNSSLPIHIRERAWESVDRQLLQMRLHAEKNCRKLRMGKTQWSPELASIRNSIKYWCLAKKKCQGFKIDRKYFRRVARSVNLPGTLNIEQSTAQTHLDRLRGELKRYKANHTNKRETWLVSLANALADAEEETNTTDSDTLRLKHLKALQQREQQRRTARIIRRVVKGSTTYQPLDHVEFTTNDNVIQTTHDRTTIEEKLIEENKQRFNQAALSPFLQPPLVQLVGRFGETEGVKQILEGRVEDRVTSSIDRYTQLLLEQMRKPKNFVPVEIDESIETFVQGWRKTKEQTASGRSRLHFGHFIAACKHNKLKHIEQRQAQFPLTTGYAPKRWQQGIEVMLLKQPNNFHVNKLRAILLFEADFNHNNKRIGRAMMQHAESNGWMAPEQYGSRKQLSAIDHCLNKRLSFDIIRQYRKPAAVCVNDMKGCYDRIVHSVASICMQRMGVNAKTLRSMFFTLQHLEHYIRTAHGVSEQSFQAKNIHPIAIQGIGQGNGAGPQIWAAISTVVLDMLRQEGMGGVFETPITKKQLHIVGYAYVDDTDIITFTGKDDEKETIQKMQENIDLWSGGLAATGGQLEPRKTYWYNINFKWQQGKWRYATKEEATADLTTTDHTGRRTSLEQVDISEGRRTLGVRLAPDGNNREEFKYLKTQADQWADKIRSGMIPRGFTWQAFTSTILAKMAYAIPATTLTQEECQQITKKLVSATLTKAGINQHLPRDLVFGHESRQGLGFPDLYVWQGAEAVARTVRFGSVSDNITGRLVNTSYELLIIETGFLHPLQEDYKRWGELATDCYMKRLW
jgi:hypothetical protein